MISTNALLNSATKLRHRLLFRIRFESSLSPLPSCSPLSLISHIPPLAGTMASTSLSDSGLSSAQWGGASTGIVPPIESQSQIVAFSSSGSSALPRILLRHPHSPFRFDGKLSLVFQGPCDFSTSRYVYANNLSTEVSKSVFIDGHSDRAPL